MGLRSIWSKRVQDKTCSTIEAEIRRKQLQFYNEIERRLLATDPMLTRNLERILEELAGYLEAPRQYVWHKGGLIGITYALPEALNVWRARLITKARERIERASFEIAREIVVEVNKP